jgi:hypothetical protein
VFLGIYLRISAFASKHQLNQACRGYKDINLLALQLLNYKTSPIKLSCPVYLFRMKYCYTKNLLRFLVCDMIITTGTEIFCRHVSALNTKSIIKTPFDYRGAMVSE